MFVLYVNCEVVLLDIFVELFEFLLEELMFDIKVENVGVIYEDCEWFVSEVDGGLVENLV